MEQIKQALKSKTVRFSLALGVLSILQGYVGFLPVSPMGQAVAGCIIASCIVVLRAATTVPLNQK
ncbi:MAG TPA: hypothetical protein DCX08_06265 [Porticoccaceae bacterium]|jgi:hypothetical protein|nr:hypothetical protein [Porticoccaceae bacterium]